ncbi:MAG: hypothetical protein AAGF47_05660 [Planctomycetota bacterium]
MTSTTTDGSVSRRRTQTALLTAVGALLAVDVFLRIEPPAAQAAMLEAAEVQPERREGRQDGRPVPPTLINPAEQRAAMLQQLRDMRRSIDQLTKRLDGQIKVQVTNFPKTQPAAD